MGQKYINSNPEGTKVSEEEVEATGWDAIEEQMSGLYGQQEPKHYAALLPYMLGERTR